ncbi:MAG: hybrid sensor histidine kinase/response regulator [Myxococcota bacterium]|nr:hybrid sensor histidine kinase/response regulator [Myxococcota bacterium]
MSRTLLLVDDEVDILEPMLILLEEDYTVLTARSGPEALEILEHASVDMIISDQRMPKMTGVELLTRVWERYPEIVRIILTGYTDTDAMIQAVNEGRVYRYIVKPWNLDDMQVVIKQGLEWNDLRQEKGQLNADLAQANKALAERTEQLERAQETIVQQEKLAAIGRFAAEMVHEMNNHLHIILGLNASLSLSMEEELPELKDLETQAKTLAEIARDIRDFAKGAVLPLAMTRADPLKTAKDVVRACKHHPAFRALDVQLITGPVSEWVMDARQIKHLLINLLKNAAKASDRNSTIEVYVATNDDALVFRITDHGVGIPDDLRERIWEPFFTTWDRQPGTGLGLSICRRSVEMHGGDIECHPTKGGGTTFIVRIPRATDEAKTG